MIWYLVIVLDVISILLIFGFIMNILLRKSKIINIFNISDFLVQITIILFWGIFLVILISSILSVLNRSLNSLSVQITTYFLFVIVVFLIFKNNSRDIIKLFFRKIQNIDWYVFIEMLILIASFVFYIYPALGLYVYPGGDDRTYSFVTLRIIEDGGFTFDLGKYLFLKSTIYFIMIGFPFLAAFFHLLLVVPIGTIHLLLTEVFHALIPLGTYSLIFVISKNRKHAIVSSFIVAFLFRSQVEYFSWGGTTEIPGYFIALSTLTIYYIVIVEKSVEFSLKHGLFLSLLIILIFSFHIMPGIFFLIGTFCLFCTEIIIKRKKVTKNALKFYGILGIFFGSIFIILYYKFQQYFLVYTKIDSYFYEKNVFSIVDKSIYMMIRYQGYYTTRIFSVLFVFFLAHGIFVFFKRNLHIKEHREKEAFLFTLFMTIFLFVLQINRNPIYNIFAVTFPFCQYIYPIRVFYSLAYPLSWIIGISMVRIYDTILENIIMFKKFIKNRKKIIHKVVSKIITSVILCSLLLSQGIITQISYNFNLLISSRKEAIVTEYDLKAYEWIKENTPEDAIFFTSGYDGGAWIPMYTHRIILPPYALRFERNLTQEQKLDFNYIINTIIYERIITLYDLYILYKYKIQYIYIGERTQYGYPLVDPNIFQNSPFFILRFKTGNVYIFEIIARNILNNFINYINTSYRDISIMLLNNNQAMFHSIYNYSKISKTFNITDCNSELVLVQNKLILKSKFIIDNDFGLLNILNITSYSVNSNSNFEILSNTKYLINNESVRWWYHNNNISRYLYFDLTQPLPLADFISLFIKGDNSNNLLLISAINEKYQIINFTDIKLNFNEWRRFVIPVKKYWTEDITSKKIVKIIFRINNTKVKQTRSNIEINGFQLGYGKWIDVAYRLPNLPILIDEKNGLVKATLASGKGNEFHSFAFWDYPYTNRSEVYSPNLFFMDNTTLFDITGYEWRYGVALYPIGANGKNVRNLRLTNGIFGRNITYPSEPGKYLGFSLYMPPDDGQDSNTSGISQVRLMVITEFDISHFFNETVTKENNYGSTRSNKVEIDIRLFTSQIRNIIYKCIEIKDCFILIARKTQKILKMWFKVSIVVTIS